jgi:ribosomal protein S12 methylthiotransferase accessory factor
MPGLPMIDNVYTGLFRTSSLSPREPQDPDVALWSAAVMPRGPRRIELSAGGAGWTEEAARAAALGEGVERFEPCRLPQDGLVEAAFDDWPLAAPAVEPERWVLFHPGQYAQPDFPFRPFTRSSTCRWAAFRRVPTGEAVWVPDEMAFLFLAGHRLAPGVSTGLSSGLPEHPVLLRGAQEVVERDAVVGAWWGRYRLEEWPREVDARLRRPHLRWRSFRIDSPYSAHATIVTVEGDGLFGAGSAVRETREASWEKSSLEAAHALAYARVLKAGMTEEEVDRLDSFAAHAAWYSFHPERLADTPFATASAPGGREDAEPLDVLAARLGPSLPILYRMMTPAGLEGRLVLRVVIPGLQPLHGSDAVPHLGGPLWAPRGPAAWRSLPPHPFA